MDLVKKLKKDYPDISFAKGRSSCWSADDKTVYYCKPVSEYDLLHELGHALEGHYDYLLDIELIKLEASAWRKACLIAKKYGITIPKQYVKKSMDTYRDWLEKRSKCPECDLTGIQAESNLNYKCINCLKTWSVSPLIKEDYRIKRVKS